MMVSRAASSLILREASIFVLLLSGDRAAGRAGAAATGWLESVARPRARLRAKGERRKVVS